MIRNLFTVVALLFVLPGLILVGVSAPSAIGVPLLGVVILAVLTLVTRELQRRSSCV